VFTLISFACIFHVKTFICPFFICLYCRSQHGCFSGIYYVSVICLGFPTLGPQAAFCKLKSVTDLQLGSARFPIIVTTECRGVEGKLCTSLFLCNWLVFLTTCEPSTAKPPWLHNPPGGYITHLLTLIWAQGFEKLSPLSLLV
jgi:hypothetical protein